MAPPGARLTERDQYFEPRIRIDGATSVTAPCSTLSRVANGGHDWAVGFTENGFQVHRDGRQLVRCDRHIVLRHFQFRKGQMSARIHCAHLSAVEFPQATSAAVDGVAVSSAPRVELPAGQHELHVVFSESGEPC